MQIVNPKREDYNNRKEYYWLVQSLNALDKTFGVVQTRIALLALFDAKKRDIISTERFKHSVLEIENFHFAFSFIRSSNTNKLEGIYSKFASKLRGCNNKIESNSVIDEYLIKQLDKLYPSFEEFLSMFILLNYSKKDKTLNMKSKYTLYRINSYYNENIMFPDNGSVEHILPEQLDKEVTLNIGNLILLEGDINEECGKLDYLQKKEIYKKSKYDWVKNFIKDHSDWNENLVEGRAEKMAEICYEKVLGKKIFRKI